MYPFIISLQHRNTIALGSHEAERCYFREKYSAFRTVFPKISYSGLRESYRKVSINFGTYLHTLECTPRICQYKCLHIILF